MQQSWRNQILRLNNHADTCMRINRHSMHWPTPLTCDIRPSQRPDQISLEAATEQFISLKAPVVTVAGVVTFASAALTHGVMLHDQDDFVHWTTVLVRHAQKKTVLCTLDHLLSVRPSVYQSNRTGLDRIKLFVCPSALWAGPDRIKLFVLVCSQLFVCVCVCVSASHLKSLQCPCILC